MNRNEYIRIASKRENRSPILKNCAFAFLSGGAVCCLGKAFSDLYIMTGIGEKTSCTLASCTLIIIAGFCTGIGCFDKAARHLGAGLLVPITGFSNAITSPAVDAKSEGFVAIGTDMFKIAGPVLVYGNLTAVIYGIIYYICKAVFI